MSQPVIDGRYAPLGYVQITDLSAATGLGNIPAGAHLALIQAEAQAVRWRDDGANPTSAIGMVLAAGETLVYNGDLSAFRAIEVTAGAVLNVAFYAGDVRLAP